MKRLLQVLVILILLVLLSIWPTKKPEPPWNVKTTMTFLGFTNAIVGAPLTNALFGFAPMPSEKVSWGGFQVGQFDGTNWVFPKPLGSYTVAFFSPGGVFNGGLTNFYLCLTVPLASTSAPTRVVISLTPYPSGRLEETWNKAKLSAARLLQLENPRQAAAGSKRYFMTNDFNFTSSTPLPP